MRHLITLSTCLVALALHSTAWAEIYETKNAEGNTEFTDSPPTENAVEVDLQETNIADAPQPQPQDESQDGTPPAVTVDQAPVEENNTVILRDGDDIEGYDNGVYGEGVDEQDLRRERAHNRADPDTPREVGDSESQLPREVGDSETQLPREVGDSEAQMPREVGDIPAGVGTGHRR